jgi:shikimate dehydrogenase
MNQHQKLYGLIGFPLSHSFSGSFFSEKFKKDNIQDSSYELFPISSIELLPELLASHPELCGLNVTIPYKEVVIPYLTKQSQAVQEIGACNCVQIKNKERIGYNTDVIGFEKMLLPHLRPHHTNALILGTGGAAKAVAWVFNKLGIRFTYVSRTHKEGIESYSNLNEELLHINTLIVNTTPLGMSPKIDVCPEIPYEFLNNTHLCVDLIYNPAKTKFLEIAENRGSAILNGLEMLIIQAEESWKIWNDL